MVAAAVAVALAIGVPGNAQIFDGTTTTTAAPSSTTTAPSCHVSQRPVTTSMISSA